MTNDQLKTALSALVQDVSYDETGEWLNVQIGPAEWKAFAAQLKADEDLAFDYLFCLTCVDWKTHLTMVYHLTSTVHRHTVVVKIKLDRNHPEVDSVSDIWRTAELHEREVFDLFGVTFLNHPDLRRLLLTEEWEGWPLRKDYEDPVNMIRL